MQLANLQSSGAAQLQKGSRTVANEGADQRGSDSLLLGSRYQACCWAAGIMPAIGQQVSGLHVNVYILAQGCPNTPLGMIDLVHYFFLFCLSISCLYFH